jgi:hypothetical protein
MILKEYGRKNINPTGIHSLDRYSVDQREETF